MLAFTHIKKNKIKRCVGVINQYTGYKKVDTPPCYTPEISLDDLHFSQMLVRTQNCTLRGEQPLHP